MAYKDALGESIDSHPSNSLGTPNTKNAPVSGNQVYEADKPIKFGD